jgi:hypothetical protein
MLPSSFHFDEASRFDATGRLHFVSVQPATSSFSCPACGFTEEKRQPPSRRSGALARREGGRAGAVQDAARGSEAIGKRASVLDCPPSAVLLRRTGGGPPPLSFQGAAWPNQLPGAWKSFFVLPHHDPSWQIKARRNRSQGLGCNSFSNALAAPAEEAGFWPVISNPSVCT